MLFSGLLSIVRLITYSEYIELCLATPIIVRQSGYRGMQKPRFMKNFFLCFSIFQQCSNTCNFVSDK